MQTPFNHKNNHHCSAVVINCMDFRFQTPVKQYIENELCIKSGDYDLISWPGSAKPINEEFANNGLVSKSINVSIDLHQVKKIIIVNHRDCGAYNGSKVFDNNQEKEKEFHIQELYKARDILQKKYPEQKIILVYADVNDNQTMIEINQI